MKSIELVRKELNLTQDEMATLLNISRSQWSLYELGLRQLSADALVKISKMHRFIHSTELEKARQFHVAGQEANNAIFIADAIKGNELNQLACEKKIAAMEKNYTAALKLHQLIQFLENPVDKKEELPAGTLLLLKEKAERLLDKNGPQELVKLEVRLKGLQYEEQLLKSLLKK